MFWAWLSMAFNSFYMYTFPLTAFLLTLLFSILPLFTAQEFYAKGLC